MDESPKPQPPVKVTQLVAKLVPVVAPSAQINGISDFYELMEYYRSRRGD